MWISCVREVQVLGPALIPLGRLSKDDKRHSGVVGIVQIERHDEWRVSRCYPTPDRQLAAPASTGNATAVTGLAAD